MAGVTVAFAVTAGGGTASPASVVTGSNGVASVSAWTLGPTPGVNVLTATAGSLPVVTFNVTSVRAPISVQATSPTTQTAPISTPVTDPPTVVVRDGAGEVMAGVTVTFSVTGGGGSVDPASVITDVDGVARLTRWTVGSNPGANTVAATVTGLTPVTFTAQAVLVPAQVSAVTSTSQAATAGTAVAQAPGVLVRTAGGVPVPNVQVTFAVTAGAGNITPPTVNTGSDGIARSTTWTLGGTPGANSVTATVAGLQPVVFSASGTEPPVATTVTAVSTTSQTAAAGSAVAAPPSVEVRDQFNNVMPGVTVTFAITAGGGGINPPTVVTNSNGIATLTQWTLGNAAGTNTVTATVSGLPVVTFNATGLLVATSIQAVSPTTQQGVVNSTVSSPPSVRVRDQFNNLLAGASVAFAVTAGGGNVTPTSQLTDATGIATVTNWTLGPNSGQNTLTATVGTLAPVTFTATAVDPCEPVGIQVGDVVNASLTSASCVLVDGGEFVRFYSFTLTETKAVRIRQSSTQIDSYLLLLRPNGQTVAEVDDISPTDLNSEIYALLTPGTYVIGATSFAQGETGSFELRLENASSNVTNCTLYFTVPTINEAQSLSSTDCEDSGFRTDEFAIFLVAGAPVTIDMTSTAVNAYLFLFDSGFQVVTSNNDGGSGTNARIVFNPTQTGFYIIGATSAAPGEIGNYVLTID